MDCSEVTTLRVREQMKRTCDGDSKSLEHRILREATRQQTKTEALELEQVDWS